MANVKITFCNRSYADKWFKNLQRSGNSHFSLLQAILYKIEVKDGRDISKCDIYDRDHNIQIIINSLNFDIIPTRGQMLKHNGNGIRHAKFSPSKSIAVIWEKIGETIFVTFDDHAPIRYHRAISHLRDIKLGKPALPKCSRNSGRFLRKLNKYWKLRYLNDFRGVDLRRRYYE